MATPFSPAVDAYIIYLILKQLTTPFEEMDAFKLGIIDKDGKLLKKPSSAKEKEAYTSMDRFVVNIKRILNKVGMDSKLGSMAAALYLIKEHHRADELTYSEMRAGLAVEYLNLTEGHYSTLKQFIEDAPANATGASVAGTGDNQVHWARQKRPRGRPRPQGKMINGVSFLKRMNRQIKQTYGTVS